jgi:hypothetical protein
MKRAKRLVLQAIDGIIRALHYWWSMITAFAGTSLFRTPGATPLSRRFREGMLFGIIRLRTVVISD